MASTKNDISNSRKTPENHREQSYDRKDEINLADYFGIIFKRKYFISSCSLVPALLFGIILFISPKNCKVTYPYDLGQDKKDLKMMLGKPNDLENLNKLIAELEKDEILARDRKILLESFFDSENLNKLADKLRENGFEEYAQELSGEKIQTSISGTLLSMTVNGKSGEDIKKISSIVRNNFETNLLTYAAKQELSNNISMLKTKIAEMEENKFCIELELDEKLLNDIRNNTFDNTREFYSFLIDITGDYQNTEFENYLNSYINKMENAIITVTPLVGNPKIHFVSENIFKKKCDCFSGVIYYNDVLSFLAGSRTKNRGPAS